MFAAEAEADVLDLTYEAAIDPSLWEPLLVRLANVVGGQRASLVFQNQATGEGKGLSPQGDPKSFQLLFEYFGARNPLLRITDLPAALRILTDEEKLPKQDLIRTEFYSDFMRRFDMHSIMVIRLAIEGSNTACINVMRPRNRDSFGGHEIDTARRLHPHLIRSYRVATKLSGMEHVQRNFADFLDRSAHCVFLVNSKAELRYANRAGEAQLARQNGLTLRGGVLRAQHPDTTNRLHALIAAAGDDEAARRKGGELASTRPGSRMPLSIMVVPARSRNLSFFETGPLVLVCVTDPEAGSAVPEQRLRNLFGFSRAEARVALQLLEGRDLQDAAAKLGLSFFTVRGHLVRMFDKTGIRRQTELVRLMTRAIGNICP